MIRTLAGPDSVGSPASGPTTEISAMMFLLVSQLGRGLREIPDRREQPVGRLELGQVPGLGQ